MMKPPTISEIKGLLEGHVGTRVRLTTTRDGRNSKSLMVLLNTPIQVCLSSRSMMVRSSVLFPTATPMS